MAPAEDLDSAAYRYAVEERNTFLHISVELVAEARQRSRSCPAKVLRLCDAGALLRELGLSRRPCVESSCGSTGENSEQTKDDSYDQTPSEKNASSTRSTRCTDEEMFITVSEDSIESLERVGYEDDGSWEGVCTVMLKNIPCRTRQEEVLDAIREVGFASEYDFFYMPVKPGAKQNSGFAFIGFPDPAVAARFRDAAAQIRFQARSSEKVPSVVPARIQGFEKNCEHFARTHVIRSRQSPIFVLRDKYDVLKLPLSPVRRRRAKGHAKKKATDKLAMDTPHSSHHSDPAACWIGG